MHPLTNRQNDMLKQIHTFLSLRDYTEQELASKLKKKGFHFDEISDFLVFLRMQGFVDDVAVGRRLLECYQGEARYGRHMIAFKLKKRGISEKAIQAIFTDYDNLDELVSAEKLIRNKYKHVNSENYAKICRFLIYRGFTEDVIRKVLESFLVDRK